MLKVLLTLAFTSVVYATTCSSLHMIVARGSTEPQGQGSIGAITEQIQNLILGSSSEGIVYPATLEDYQSSESQGATAMVQAITDYTQACPDSKIALLGYSQGAQVIGDALGGGSFNSSQAPIDTSLTKNVIAVIQFADPAHVTGKSYDVGTSTNNGTFPRADTTVLDQYSNVLQSYCIAEDRFCDSGNSVLVHLSEVLINGPAAVGFVVQTAQAALGL